MVRGSPLAVIEVNSPLVFNERPGLTFIGLRLTHLLFIVSDYFRESRFLFIFEAPGQSSEAVTTLMGLCSCYLAHLERETYYI